MNETNHNFPWQLERGTARIFEPQQQAEILNWFGRDEIPRQQKEDFLQALIQFEDGCGGFYKYRAHFLAAEALSRFPDSQFGDEIVAQLLRWSYADFQPYPHWQKFPLPLVLSAQQVLERTDRKRVIAAFVEQLRAVEYRWVLCRIAKCLGKFDPGNPTAIAALVGLIEIEKKPEIVLAAARGLIQTDVQHSVVIPTLIELAKQRPISYSVLQEVTLALAMLDFCREEVVDLLRELTQVRVEYFLERYYILDNIALNSQRAASKYRQQLAEGDRKALDILLELFRKTSEGFELHYSIFSYGLSILENIAVADEATIAVLTELLEKPELSNYRRDLAKTLVAIDPSNQAAIEILAPLLEPPLEDESMSEPERICMYINACYSRCFAAEALAGIEAYRAPAISSLQEIVSSFLYDSCSDTALSAFAILDPTKKLAIETVLKALEESLEIIKVGSRTGFELTLKQMSEWVAESKNILLRQKAIATLTAFIEQMNLCQESSKPKEQIKAAAIALGKIAPNHPLALSVILQTFEAEKDVEREDETEDDVEKKYRRFWLYFRDLAEIGALDRVPVAQVIEIFQLDEFCEARQSYWISIAEILERHIQQISESSLAQWVRSLKPYLGETYYRHPYSGYEACYRIIWNCAQAMSYPVFYNAWN